MRRFKFTEMMTHFHSPNSKSSLKAVQVDAVVILFANQKKKLESGLRINIFSFLKMNKDLELRTIPTLLKVRRPSGGTKFPQQAMSCIKRN